MKKIILILTALLLGFSNAQEKGNFVLVVDKSIPIDSISEDELSAIYLKKKRKWPDGLRIKPVDQISSSKIRSTFSEVVHGRQVASIKAYWQKQIFTGEGVPPPEKTSDTEVLSYLAENKGAIGYISAQGKIDTTRFKKINLR